MHPVRRTVPIALAVAVALGTAVGACSSDSTAGASADTTGPKAGSTVASAPPTTRLTRAQFVDQANALCTTEGKEIDKVIGPVFGAGQPTAADQQKALDTIVALSRGLAHDLDALPEPAALTDDVDALVTALEAGTDTAEAQTGAEFFSGKDDPWSDASAKAAAMGLDACGPQNGD